MQSMAAAPYTQVVELVDWPASNWANGIRHVGEPGLAAFLAEHMTQRVGHGLDLNYLGDPSSPQPNSRAGAARLRPRRMPCQRAAVAELRAVVVVDDQNVHLTGNRSFAMDVRCAVAMVGGPTRRCRPRDSGFRLGVTEFGNCWDLADYSKPTAQARSARSSASVRPAGSGWVADTPAGRTAMVPSSAASTASRVGDSISATVTRRPSSADSDVTPASAMPHGTIRSNAVRSASQLSAKPCSVTPRWTRTPMAAILRSGPRSSAPSHTADRPGTRPPRTPMSVTTVIRACSRRRT